MISRYASNLHWRSQSLTKKTGRPRNGSYRFKKNPHKAKRPRTKTMKICNNSISNLLLCVRSPVDPKKFPMETDRSFSIVCLWHVSIMSVFMINDRIDMVLRLCKKGASIDEINSTDYKRLLGFYYAIMIIHSIRRIDNAFIPLIFHWSGRHIKHQLAGTFQIHDCYTK